MAIGGLRLINPITSPTHGRSPEILDRADEQAKRFENYEPHPADEQGAEEYLLERAIVARARGQRPVVDAV